LLSVAREIFIERGYRAATMELVAAAAGITKKTIYAWHEDKEALFRQCVAYGAQRFPLLRPNPNATIKSALVQYIQALHTELASKDSVGLGMLAMREGADFPELLIHFRRTYDEHLLHPLAHFLTRYGLEEAGRTERAALFINMALTPLHNYMMLGTYLPTDEEIQEHANLCAVIFCAQRM
jgi:TetR/AcrR family transcriptional repressor of mexJK operon